MSGSGTVEKMTIDEQAVGSTVRIDQGAVVEELNLDTATTVSGKGDIGTVNINAPGCVIEMLPDIINIRPGITANVDGTIMDNTLAQQMSDKPRILSGYPRMDDIAPNQATASFMTNKPGKLYWAVRLSGDGAFTASDLIEPPSYGGKIVKSGNLSVSDANTKLSQKISGLQIDTSYVLSAVLVDSRGDYSVVKSVYFTTPDNSSLPLHRVIRRPAPLKILMLTSMSRPPRLVRCIGRSTRRVCRLRPPMTLRMAR